MKQWRSIAGVGLVLLLGILIGSAGTHFYLKQRYHHFPDRKVRTARLMEALSGELALSEGQRAAVSQTLDRMSERLHNLYSQARPEAERIVEESFSEIRQQLNEEQKKKLDILRERHRRHRHRPDW
ncbi:MAG: hypothetical protein ABSE25_03205 [Syntrophorhabdales bacterium]|jgi:predicted  nucleic acid-binding Zn-ribbon protein